MARATYPMTGASTLDPDDASLIREVVAGSHDAIAALYDRHADAVYAAVLRLTTDRGLAEDVVQETFLALWDHAEQFDATRGSLAAWLHTIARNRTVDRLRAAGRRPTLVPMSSLTGDRASGRDEADGEALERAFATGDLVAAARPAPSPEMAADLRESRAAIRDALAAMPDVERTVIVMAYGEDLTQAEIAERLGWPLGTVKTRTRRALAHLRAALGQLAGDEEPRDVVVRAGRD
ncbi:MAG: sigma-70 family RNA polymerase sigma factor [Chloroflexota bacterium]